MTLLRNTKNLFVLFGLSFFHMGWATAETKEASFVFTSASDCYAPTKNQWASCIQKSPTLRQWTSLLNYEQLNKYWTNDRIGRYGYCLEVLLKNNSSLPNQLKTIGICANVQLLDAPDLLTLQSCMQTQYTTHEPAYWETAMNYCTGDVLH